MGCKVDVTHHVTCHVSTTFHVIAMSSVMSLTMSIYAIHVIAKSPATSSSISSMSDMAIESVTKIILFVMFIFVIENGLGLGFGGRGHSITVSKHHGSNNP